MEKLRQKLQSNGYLLSFVCGLFGTLFVRIVGWSAGVDPDSDHIYPFTLIAVVATSVGMLITISPWVHQDDEDD